jgi:hypothetical protein
MKSARLLFTLMLVSVVMTASSCDDSPTRPLPSADEEQLSAGGWLTTLKQTISRIDSCASLPNTTVSQVVGKQGGRIVVGPDTLWIPANALSKPVTITATLPDGYFVNVVRFEPSGLRFKKAATLVMGYSNCNVLSGTSARIAQVDDNLGVLEYLSSFDDKNGKKVYGAVNHFSNYAIAW